MSVNRVTRPRVLSATKHVFRLLGEDPSSDRSSGADQPAGWQAEAQPIQEKVVLIVDDNADDATLTVFALQRCDPTLRVQALASSEAAMAYFKGEGDYAERENHPLPDLVLVDLRLPRISGFELVKWLRHHPAARGLGVVVMSGIGNTQDANRAYECGADSYLVKTGVLDELVKIMEAVVVGWFRFGQLPRSVAHPPST